MVDIPLPALQAQAPTVNGAANFIQGAQAATDQHSQQLAQVQASMGLMGSVALGAMNGNINGQADPQKWAQGQALLKAHGIDMSQYGADFAPTLARAAIGALPQVQQAQNEQQLQLAAQQFQNTMKQQSFGNTMAVNQANYQQHSELQPQGYYGSTTPDAARAAAGLPPLPTIGPDGQPIAPAPGAAAAAPAMAGGTNLATPMGQPVGGMMPNSPGAQQAKTVGDGIINGDIPPDTLGKFSHYTAPVMAYLKEQGYDLTKAQLQIAGEKKHIQAMNSTQQLKMRQSVATVSDSLNLASQLADEWKGSGFPAFNAATLQTAKAGALGPEAQSLAERLDAQIADVTSELGTVYKGGNSSTDESLKLAAKNLDANWSQQTFDDAIKQIRQNIGFRVQAMNSVGSSATGADNPYAIDSGVSGPDVSAPSGGKVFNYNAETGELE